MIGTPPAFETLADARDGRGYGLGFRPHSYRRERVVRHKGGWIGWGTLMTMLPDRGVGVAVFTNRNQSTVPEILANYVFDRVSGKEPIPRFDRYRERRRKLLVQLDFDRQARKATRRLNTRPSHDLADYVGDYGHPDYRRITITDAEGKLNWAYRGISEPLAHRHYDTFELPEAPGRLVPPIRTEEGHRIRRAFVVETGRGTNWDEAHECAEERRLGLALRADSSVAHTR